MNKIVKKVWGHEEIIVNIPLYCCKILYVKQGYQCSLHHHAKKHETFYITDGVVRMEVGSHKKVMSGGHMIQIEPFVKHRFTGLTHCQILEISTQHFDDDSYRVKGEESRYVGWKVCYTPNECIGRLSIGD
jgi:mannose-6-phosphate isomerase-like protein (cupin superfamily)